MTAVLTNSLVPGKRVGRRQYYRELEISRFNRLHQKIDGGCWVWVGTKGRYDGYGRFGGTGAQYQMVLAHRWSYQYFVGQIPLGLSIDHLCRNRLCVNPEHLEAVTPTENNIRAVPFRKGIATESACKNGHRWTQQTIYLAPTGKRDCRSCRNISAAKTRARKRAK